MLMSQLIISCTKREVTIIHENDTGVISDNTPPSYIHITSIQVDNYVNKLYIDLYGREPTNLELEDGNDMLRDGNLSSSIRTAFVEDLISETEFFTRLGSIYRGSYLSGITLSDINQSILLFSYQRDLYLSQGNQPLADILQVEIDKFQSLYDAEAALEDGVIKIGDFMTRIAYNSLYDEINMGTENFVIACFENFIKRYPTDVELLAGSSMVDGSPGQLFMQDASSKLEFINLITSSDEFYQGLVSDFHNQLLSRKPTTDEMLSGVQAIAQNEDYQDVQLKILISDEYAGF